MAHILVKWPTENKWDVYPLKNVVDASIGLDVLGDTSAALERLEDETVDIIWEAGKPAAPAKILAVGKASSLEKKRALLAKKAAPADSAVESEAMEPKCNCAQEKERLEGIIEQQANEISQLKLELQQAHDCLDAAKMVKRLQKILSESEAENVVPSQKVDLGEGVMVDEASLARIKNDSKNSGCRFARGLLRTLFSPEELTNKSLFGKKSNSHKDSTLKEALDSCRVNAVLGYTLKNFSDVTSLHVKNTLSSMLARDYSSKTED